MRKIKSLVCTALTVLAVGISTGYAQNTSKTEPCGTDIYHHTKISEDAHYAEGISNAERIAQKWIENNPTKLKQKGENKIVIPVVFHVVYNKDSVKTQKIAYERILEQIEILNRDFNRDNTDKSKTRPVFDTIAESVEVVFALATKDPSGQVSTGVTYTETDVKGFDILPFLPGYVPLDSLKTTSGGGQSAWIGDYLNVWVARLTYLTTEGLYGIATFPQTAPSNEVAGQEPTPDKFQGVSVLTKTVGNLLNTKGDTVFAGRTLTHEIGHFFGLRHIWGDGQDATCNATDFVDDTPKAINNANFVCNFNLNECAQEDAYWAGTNPPNNIENYMDYSGDLCQNMFSQGQSVRMLGFLNTERTALWDSSSAGGKDGTQFKSWTLTEATTCPETCDGKVTIKTEKNTGNVTYYLDSVQVNSNVLIDVCTGIHTVMVIDNNLDTIAYDIYVPAGKLIPLKFTKQTEESSCPTCADGVARVNISTGNAPFEIVWNTTPSVTGDSISNLLPGTYFFTITDACGNFKSDSVVVSTTVSIQDLSFDALIIAPNPTTGTLNIRLPQAHAIHAVHVVDMRGRTVKTFKNIGKTSELSLDVSEIETGAYLVQLVDQTGHALTTRFAKH